ncbi:hypothetical protein ACWEDF_27390 [Micromonospora chersina]
MVGLDGGHRLEWILYFGGEARELQLRAEIDYPLTDEPWGCAGSSSVTRTAR